MKSQKHIITHDTLAVRKRWCEDPHLEAIAGLNRDSSVQRYAKFNSEQALVTGRGSDGELKPGHLEEVNDRFQCFCPALSNICH